jgi:hypothetical protein
MRTSVHSSLPQEEAAETLRLLWRRILSPDVAVENSGGRSNLLAGKVPKAVASAARVIARIKT